MRISRTAGKKYDVLYNGRWIPFGDVRYQQYRDTTGIGAYSHLDHGNKTRRESYRARHAAIMDKSGKPAYTDRNNAAYWSYHYLW